MGQVSNEMQDMQSNLDQIQGSAGKHLREFKQTKSLIFFAFSSIIQGTSQFRTTN